MFSKVFTHKSWHLLSSSMTAPATPEITRNIRFSALQTINGNNDGSYVSELGPYEFHVIEASDDFFITGSPRTRTRAMTTYEFTPQIISPLPDMTFFIDNKPDWATLNKTTGTLSGLPTSSAYKVGIYAVSPQAESKTARGLLTPVCSSSIESKYACTPIALTRSF